MQYRGEPGKAGQPRHTDPLLRLSVRPSTSVSDVSRGWTAKAESLPRPRPHPSQGQHCLLTLALMPYRHTRLYAFLFASLLARGVVSRVCRSKARDVTPHVRLSASLPSNSISLYLHIPELFYSYDCLTYEKWHYSKMIPLMAAAIELLYLQS